MPLNERRRGIGRDVKSPIATIGVLSLGLILPLGLGPFSDKAVALLTSSVEGQTKTVTLVRDGEAQAIRTRSATVADLLLEQNIVRTPQDELDADPSSSLEDGETIHYRPAVPVTIIVDDVPQTVRTPATTVAGALAAAGVAYDRHDRVEPAPAGGIAAEQTVRVEHVNAWIEKIHRPLAPPVKHIASFDLALGATSIVNLGASGTRELSYLVTRTSDRTAAPQRSLLAVRIIRAPRTRVIAVGIGEYASLAALAKRGFDGTVRLAKAAMSMVATAYTANCYGCSGYTATGRRAGHGIVAVDPGVIPLGSRLFIPGYGRALAGDTGGAIHGNRIDLGFNSYADALQFGRRSVTVYVLGP